ncbi:MAG: trypsin-like peptidase domain-containing protein [Porphyromonas sp.]|nr:trypsin-like peptidase domain-containing protein [Porphyromonas sp.]
MNNPISYRGVAQPALAPCLKARVQSLRSSLVCLLSLCLLTLGAHSLSAQFRVPARPSSLTMQSKAQARSLTKVDTLEITPPSAERLRRLTQVDPQSQVRTLSFAETLPLDLSPSTHGEWQTAADGSQVWRLSLRCRGAKTLGLYLDRYRLPEGAALFVHSAESGLRGAFTHMNNNAHNILSLAHLRGEALSLELNLPAGMARSAVELHLAQLHYGVLDLYEQGEGLRASAVSNAMGEPFYNHRGTGLQRLSCAPNAVAYPEYRAQARSVVLMVMEGNTMGTGALINSTRNDGTAYVLTAAHNVNRLYNGTAESWDKVNEICRSTVFFFGFESPSRDQNLRGTEELTLSGAELVAYNTDADMALLRITGLPTNDAGQAYIPDYYNVYYSGWNISPRPVAPFYGIHHPLASTKRVCIAADQELRIVDYDLSVYQWTQSHWRVLAWETGITEAGSSGSPLFDKDGAIIGALSGGSSTCSNPTRDTYYAIHKTWTNTDPSRALKPWLDPDGTGATTLSGYDPHASATGIISRISPYYGQSTKDLVWRSYQPISGVAGIGRTVSIKGSVQPLGVYLHLGEGNTTLTPGQSYQIELRRIDGKTAETEPLWTAQLDDYLYKAYDAKADGFTTAQRTVGLDELELFVPGTELPTLSAGEYLLSIRNADDSKQLDYPLLTDNRRATSIYRAYDIWHKRSGGAWGIAEGAQQSVWLDLLVKGTKQEYELLRSDSEQTLYPSYYYAGDVYVHNPGGALTLRVYSLDGYLWQTNELGEGESRTSLMALPTGYVYVVQLVGDLGKRSYKIIKK